MAADAGRARNTIINTLPKFPREAIIYYNLACYDCQLNRMESANQYLKQSFRIEPNWTVQALGDEDLEPLWDYLGGLRNEDLQVASDFARNERKSDVLVNTLDSRRNSRYTHMLGLKPHHESIAHHPYDASQCLCC
jgi:hypothetical protein